MTVIEYSLQIFNYSNNSTTYSLFTLPKYTLALWLPLSHVGTGTAGRQEMSKSETSADCSFPTYLPWFSSTMYFNHPSRQKAFKLTEDNPAATFDTIRDIFLHPSLSLYAERQWAS